MPDPELRGRFEVAHRCRSNRFDLAQAEEGLVQLSGGCGLCPYLIWFGSASQTTSICSSCRLAGWQLYRRNLQQMTETARIETGKAVSAGSLAHMANLEASNYVSGSSCLSVTPLQVKEYRATSS